jgi:ABC-type transport system substrate-binding protein
MQGYWQRTLRQRMSRRRSLGIMGGTAAGAFLAACGGDDETSPTPTAQASTGSTGATGSTGVTGSTGPSPTAAPSGLVAVPTDTTSKAVYGGTLVGQAQADPTSFDILTGQPSDIAMLARAYSRLVKYKSFKYPEAIQPVAEPDAAASWEYSGDGTQVTYKIRPNLSFDPRPPTEGRAMTAQDVKFSFDRFFEISTTRATLDNSLDPNAPVVSTEAVDDETFVIKLAFPYAPLDMLIASSRYVSIMPAEAGSEFDVANTLRGSGAYRLEDYQAGSRYEFVKNEDWYDADKVHLDGMNMVILSDPATIQSQFLAGNLWLWSAFPQEQILSTKDDMPELLMYAQEEFSAGANWMRFGYLPDSPFIDERVRRAASMSIDRDLFIDTFGNVEQFEAAGIEVARRWNSSIPAGESFWLDPKDEAKYGEGAAYYKYDPADAKKLIEAAGLTAPIGSSIHWPVPVTPTPFPKEVEVIHGMLQDSGNFTLELTSYTNYPAEFLPKYVDGGNQWDGISMSLTSARAELDTLLFEYLYHNGTRAGHVMANGEPDEELQSLIQKQRAALDLEDREAIVHDIQRRASAQMYMMWMPGQALGFDLIHPWLQNYGLWRSKTGGSQAQEGNVYWWYDESKA